MLTRAQKGLPQEVCGLLAGNGRQVYVHYPITNVEFNQSKYRMESLELIDATLDIEKRGLDLMAIYHSHPSGPDCLSASDIRENNYPGVVQIILTPHIGGWEIHAYVIENDDNIQAIAFE